MKKIYTVSGYPRVGKTTFSRLVRSMADVPVIRTSMVEKAKQIAFALGWDGDKGDFDRQALSSIKDAIDAWSDLSYVHVAKVINNAPDDAIVFIDAREPDDIERLKKDFGAKTIWIERGDQPVDFACEVDSIRMSHYDIIIDNNGTIDDLINKVLKLI